MTSIKNWIKITNGIYKYTITPNMYYELDIQYWDVNNDIMKSVASLYIVKTGNSFVKLCLLSNRRLFECILQATTSISETMFFITNISKLLFI